MSNICCVSGYWTVKNKYNSNDYINNFKYTLPLKCDFIFFSDEDNFKNLAKDIRKDLSSNFINLSINKFLSYKYKDFLITPKFIHNIHCPSIDLWLIWSEKVNLIKLASNISNYEWYCWYDAGLAKYRKRRGNLPVSKWPNEKKMSLLKKDKINVTNKSFGLICGTSYIIHRTFIDTFHNMFYNLIDEYVIQKKSIPQKLRNIGFENVYDQTLLTHLFINNPDSFNILTNGFGGNIDFLC